MLQIKYNVSKIFQRGIQKVDYFHSVLRKKCLSYLSFKRLCHDIIFCFGEPLREDERS